MLADEDYQASREVGLIPTKNHPTQWETLAPASNSVNTNTFLHFCYIVLGVSPVIDTSIST